MITPDPGPWDSLPPKPAELEAPLSGWRYYGAGSQLPLNGKWYPGAVLVPPIETHKQTDTHVIDGPDIGAAYCRRGDRAQGGAHAAPGQSCGCGFRLVRKLPDLIPYIRELNPDPSHGDTCLAVVRVRGLGIAASGVTDPPGTARVQRIELVGPIYLAPVLAYKAQDFRRTFGIKVVARGKGTFATWLDRMERGRL